MLGNSELTRPSGLSYLGAMRRHGLLCLSIALYSSIWSLSTEAREAFREFDPLGSVQTEPFAINRSNDIAGQYYDASGTLHGFLRTSDGTITTIDYPGALYTQAISINRWDTISGSYVASDTLLTHGFLRTADGTLTPYDVPGSSQTYGGADINDNGSVVGFYMTVSTGGHYRGFVRAAGGSFTLYDAPGASDTVPESINKRGWIAGFYWDIVDMNYVWHGFLRSPVGVITPIDVAGAQGTRVDHVDDKNDVVGTYWGSDNLSHGFLRTSDGTITTFDVPGATQTLAYSGAYRHASGPVADGTTLDVNMHFAGFLRLADGTFLTVIEPFAGTGPNQGTLPFGMNARNMTGWYIDSGGVKHGFMGHP